MLSTSYKFIYQFFQERSLAKFFTRDGLNTTKFTFKEQTTNNLYKHLIIDLPGPNDEKECQKYYAQEVQRLTNATHIPVYKII